MTVSIPLQRLEGKYEILEKLSEGGMGAIYKVRHRLLDEVRVVKVMRPHLAEDEVLRARFMREAKVAIRLKHPNLAQVYDFTMDEEGYFFLVMEFIEGMDLFSIQRIAGSVPLGVALEIAYQSLGVLGYLHRKEIVHRDISPDNLLVSKDDDGDLLIKLIDLGIAKVQQADEHLTATGTFLGKVRYSSPEQFRTEGGTDIGPRSDLYSFGIVLYQILTGKYPIKGKNISSLISGHLLHAPLSFEESDPEGRVPEDLRSFVMKALRKDPEERFPSARAFRTKIGELRERYPIRDKEVREIFEMPSLPTSKIKVEKPGSTQDHLNRNFGVETTPAHTAPTIVESEHGASGPGGGEAAREETGKVAGGTQDHHLRALLMGAEKLIRNEHFDEARLQIEAVQAMAPANPEVSKLLDVLNEADTRLKAKREVAVGKIEAMLTQGEFGDARREFDSWVKRLGPAACFSEIGEAIAVAEAAAEAKAEQVAGILDAVRDLIVNESWEDAAPMAREVLTLDPSSRDAADLLKQAEDGQSRRLEAERRFKEIEKTRQAIDREIENEAPDEARKALLLARKLYGLEPAFDEFEGRIEELEGKLLLRRAETLIEEGRTHLKDRDFDLAIDKLEQSLLAVADNEESAALLAEAREERRLEEEARRRREAIGAVVVGVDRLVTAGRLETAVRKLDLATAEFGEFEGVDEVRARVEEELAALKGREKEIDRRIRGARKEADKHRYEKASSELDAARSAANGDPAHLELVDAESETIHLRARAHRRDLDIAAAVSSIGKHIDGGDLGRADHELKLAGRVYGDEEVFSDLRSRIDRARRLERVAELLSAARSEGVDLSEAVTALEAARDLDPENAEIEDLLAQARAAKSERDDEIRDGILAEALAPVDELIVAGRFDQALEALAKAEEILEPSPQIRTLRYRLQRVLEPE